MYAVRDIRFWDKFDDTVRRAVAHAGKTVNIKYDRHYVQASAETVASGSKYIVWTKDKRTADGILEEIYGAIPAAKDEDPALRPVVINTVTADDSRPVLSIKEAKQSTVMSQNEIIGKIGIWARSTVKGIRKDSAEEYDANQKQIGYLEQALLDVEDDAEKLKIADQIKVIKKRSEAMMKEAGSTIMAISAKEDEAVKALTDDEDFYFRYVTSGGESFRLTYYNEEAGKRLQISVGNLLIYISKRLDSIVDTSIRKKRSDAGKRYDVVFRLSLGDYSEYDPIIARVPDQGKAAQMVEARHQREKERFDRYMERHTKADK